jgi:two-component system, NarL family, response regulator YdfI
MNHPIRVVIADDHLMVRKGLRLMLEEMGEGILLVGEATDGAVALRLISDVQPDVILMDLHMPGMGGLEALEHIRVEFPRVAVLILTIYNEDALMIRGLRGGVCGYLLKDTSQETLYHAICTAARGELLMQLEIMARLLSQIPQRPLSPPPWERALLELTEREREVLEAIACGCRSKEIAARLAITTRTVGAHLTSIYTKLGVDSRTSAVAVALEQGLLSR